MGCLNFFGIIEVLFNKLVNLPRFFGTINLGGFNAMIYKLFRFSVFNFK